MKQIKRMVNFLNNNGNIIISKDKIVTSDSFIMLISDIPKEFNTNNLEFCIPVNQHLYFIDGVEYTFTKKNDNTVVVDILVNDDYLELPQKHFKKAPLHIFKFGETTNTILHKNDFNIELLEKDRFGATFFNPSYEQVSEKSYIKKDKNFALSNNHLLILFDIDNKWFVKNIGRSHTSCFYNKKYNITALLSHGVWGSKTIKL